MRLAIVLAFLLSLTGCGDDGGGSQSGGDGQGLKPLPQIVLSYGNNSRPYMPSPSSVATQIALFLRDVGFEVQLQKEEWASYLSMVKNGEHQMALLGWSADYPDADNFLYVLLDKDNARPGSANNISFYRDEQVHEWLIAARTSHDQAERTQLYHKAQEKIFDIAWSEGRHRDANGRLAAVGNTADIRTGKTSNTIGAAQLTTVWVDPEFDNQVSAVYYARVLQIPTVRHSQLDAVAMGRETPYEGPATIQERAYTSPIWYSPDSPRE